MARESSFNLPALTEEKSTDVPSIKNVWFDNFEEELPIISELLDKYPYIAMVSLLSTTKKAISHNWLNNIMLFRTQNFPELL